MVPGTSILGSWNSHCVSQTLVRVHVADVAALVLSGGDLDLHAARRGCSIFIRDHQEELQRHGEKYDPLNS